MGPAAERIAVAINQSDLTDPWIDVVGAAKAFGMRVALRLAGHRPSADLPVASRSRRVVDDRVPQALESRHLTLVPRSRVVDRPVKVDIQEILAAWRATERALGVISKSDPEWALVHARFISLRASYHQLFAERCDRPPGSEVPRRVVDRREVAEGLP